LQAEGIVTALILIVTGKRREQRRFRIGYRFYGLWLRKEAAKKTKDGWALKNRAFCRLAIFTDNHIHLSEGSKTHTRKVAT